MRDTSSKSSMSAPDAKELLTECNEPNRRWRLFVSIMIFLGIMINYVVRTNIGIVIGAEPAGFSQELHQSKGLILGAFYMGYMWTQFVGGVMARKLGGLPVFLIAAVLWTACDNLTPLLAADDAVDNMGVWPVVVARVGLGLAQGPVFACQQSLCAYWVPKEERASLVSFVAAGVDMGAVVAFLCTPPLLQAIGWQSLFGLWNGIGLVWIVVFYLFGASSPEEHPACKASGEADVICSTRGDVPRRGTAVPTSTQVSVRTMLLSKSCWAIILAHCCSNYALFVLLSWLPQWWPSRHGVNLSTHPFYGAVPYMVGLCGAILAGRLSDLALNRCGNRLRVRHVRKGAMLIGGLGASTFLLLTNLTDSALAASSLLSAAFFFQRMQKAGFWVNMLDVAGSDAGKLCGIANTIATIPGIVGQPLTHKILDVTGSWTYVFGLAACAQLLGATLFLLMADDQMLAKADETSTGLNVVQTELAASFTNADRNMEAS
eukprot:TRINITY_DN5265_c0_g2_i1.p1 TRINITY_DN5265_c0_g2~~TRINITY_DN5265_c0_g2_i1.p1  ORF type:complete len:489 (+),score=39.13 TRINITY_DN5265_c0_g2_i1:49-1515(+)